MKVRVPLVRRTSDGVACPTPVVRLRVRDRYGRFAEIDFRVDTQADVTTLPASLAEKEGLPFAKARPGRARGITGSVVKYRDRLRVVIAGREHDWPCDFTEAAADPETRRPLPELSPVLGRAGFLDEYAVAVDSGYLLITRLGSLRRLLPRWLHRCWAWCGRVHPPQRPL